MKSAIVERLGQAELLLPTLIAEGLDASCGNLICINDAPNASFMIAMDL
jgi:hypothetical protein